MSTRPIRVVQLSLHADPAGRSGEELLAAWPTLPAIAGAAARAGAEVTVVQTAARAETIARDGVVFHFVPGRYHNWGRVIAHVASLRADVVHVQGLNFPRAMRPLAKALLGTPLLAQDRGNILPAGWRKVAWRWAHGALAGVSFTSRDQAEPWKRARIFRQSLPVFEVLGASTAFRVGDVAAARRVTGMDGDPCIFWCGRLDANKDPMMMLRAIERAATTLPGLRLYCAYGDAPLIATVRDQVARSAFLSSRVTLLGQRPREEVEARFQSADLFVQTSHREGVSFALLEAMACGTTPVVTDIPSARRIVGDAGAFAPVGDDVALSRTIIEQSRRARPAARVATRRRFDEALTYDVIGRELLAAYRALVQ